MTRILTAVAFLAASAAFAQGLELPAASPAAKVTQRIGLTDVTVEYSSPGVKGRKIFGTVVPLNQVWRTGANGATTVTFSQPVKIGGKDVPAGTYGLLSIPGLSNWTLIVSKNTSVTSPGAYQESEDVVRVQAKPQRIPARERLTFLFSDFDDAGGKLDLEWEKVRVSLPIEVATAAQVKQNVEQSLGQAWRPFANAARYNLGTKGDLNQALTWADQSISLQENWFNVWTKAEILNALGKKDEALAQAQKAKELGSKNPQGFFFAADVEKALTSWKK